MAAVQKCYEQKMLCFLQNKKQRCKNLFDAKIYFCITLCKGKCSATQLSQGMRLLNDGVAFCSAKCYTLK